MNPYNLRDEKFIKIMFRKFLWVFIEKGAVMTIQFVTLLILSRLLSPQEYGIYGIMLIFISISDLLVDSGFGGAIIQKKNVTQIDIDTLFVTNTGIAACLYVVLFLIAGLVQRFYGVENLSSYLRVLGLSIVFFSFSIVPNSMMMKELRFRKIAIITVISTFLSSVIAIILASHGMGVWVLVLQQVLNSLFLALLLWLLSGVRVRLKYSNESFRSLWSFGSNLLFANLLSTIYNNISSSIVPKISSLNEAGYFNQARRLQSLPNNVIYMSIDKAAFPILSQEKTIKNVLTQGRYINRFVFALCSCLFPALSLASQPIIQILLGNEWLESAPYLSILFWAGFGLLIHALYRNMFKSAGFTKIIFKVEIINTLVGLTILLSAVSGGIMLIIYGIVLSSIITACLWFYFANIKFSYSIKQQINDFVPSLLIAMVSFASCYIVSRFFGGSYSSLFWSGVLIIVYFTLGRITKNSAITSVIQFCLSKVKVSK